MQLQDWFRTEADNLLAGLERAVAGASGEDAAVVARRCARELHGVARLAGAARVAHAAGTIERALRASDADSDLPDRVRESVTDLRVLLDGERDTAELDARADAIVARWAAAATGAERPIAAVDDEAPSFVAFVARETAGIAETMERSVAAFNENPADREALGAILRRQRALLGAARLDDFAVVAEALRAVENLSELIVRLDVPVKSEWLDVFRCARDVLQSAGTQLEQGETPEQTHSLRRLRVLRDEIGDRYGDKEYADRSAAPAVRPPAPSGATIAATVMGAAPPFTPVATVVPDAATDTGDRATSTLPDDGAPAGGAAAPVAGSAGVSADLRADIRHRAALLRAEIEQGLVEDSRAVAALDELHELLLDALE